MTTTSQNQAETRFVALMTELFQMDEAQALDFGIYRVIRRHNQEVRAFLGEIVTTGEDARLEGGRLGALLDAAFAASDRETAAGDRYRLQAIADQLGLKPGMDHRTARGPPRPGRGHAHRQAPGRGIQCRRRT
jgi:adenine-specific DNA-methyltransferase